MQPQTIPSLPGQEMDRDTFVKLVAAGCDVVSLPTSYQVAQRQHRAFYGKDHSLDLEGVKSAKRRLAQ